MYYTPAATTSREAGKLMSQTFTRDCALCFLEAKTGSLKKGGSGIAGSLHGAANLSKIWHKSVTDVALDILRINLFYTVKISTFCRWGVWDGEVIEGGGGRGTERS